MNPLKYVAVNGIETLLRVFPFPRKTGLLKIGSPGGSSPVFLTCNYHLTVERVKRALRGMDAYLLVANSRGVNVWCAAAGGLFTSHDVISILRTSGIEERVDHRNVILPQLAAAGVEAGLITGKTGWRVTWGPVYAKDIPLFVKNGLEKTTEMREVGFPLRQRIEMAVAWAFPISVVAALMALPLWRGAILPLVLLVWGFSFAVFTSFPLYRRRLSPGRKMVGFVFFDFGRGGLQLIAWVIFMLGLIVYANVTGNFTWGFILRWGFVSFIAVLLLSLDVMGSTPVCKSGLHGDRLLRVVLDADRCRGDGICGRVCPRNCFEVDKDRRVATMPGASRCVRCGACIIQCPFDALYFEAPGGGVIPPRNTRAFRVDLRGARNVKVVEG